MTNKNKRTKSRAESKKDSAGSSSSTTTTPRPSSSRMMDPPPPKGIMTRGQLTALIFLCIGITRLFQVGDAIRKKEGTYDLSSHDNNTSTDIFQNQTDTTSPETQASKTCLLFFNGTGNGHDWTPASTCLEDGFTALLEYKYALGWQVAALVAAVVLQCWHVEAWLMRFNVGLVLFSPIFPSVVALLGMVPTLVSKASVWPHVVMALVLSYVGSPTSVDWIPFVRSSASLSSAAAGRIPPRNNPKSLQSVVLLACACLFFLQATLQWGIPAVQSTLTLLKKGSAGNTGANNQGLSWINEELLSNATNTPSSLIVVILLLVDKLTMSLVYAFSWFYLPEQHQRTLLLYTGVIFFCVATYQWTWLDGKIANAETMRAMDWALAGCGIVAWVAPSFSAATPPKAHVE